MSHLARKTFDRRSKSIKRIVYTNNYEVQAIRRKRKNSADETEYLVKWVGYGETQNTWEPCCHLSDARDLIQQFLGRQNGPREKNTIDDQFEQYKRLLSEDKSASKTLVGKGHAYSLMDKLSNPKQSLIVKNEIKPKISFFPQKISKPTMPRPSEKLFQKNIADFFLISQKKSKEFVEFQSKPLANNKHPSEPKEFCSQKEKCLSSKILFQTKEITTQNFFEYCSKKKSTTIFKDRSSQKNEMKSNSLSKESLDLIQVRQVSIKDIRKKSSILQIAQSSIDSDRKSCLHSGQVYSYQAKNLETSVSIPPKITSHKVSEKKAVEVQPRRKYGLRKYRVLADGETIELGFNHEQVRKIKPQKIEASQSDDDGFQFGPNQRKNVINSIRQLNGIRSARIQLHNRKPYFSIVCNEKGSRLKIDQRNILKINPKWISEFYMMYI